MLAFQTTPKQILELAEAKQLAARVAAHQSAAGFDVKASERFSWEESLPALAREVTAAGLGDLDALVECQLPRSSRRIDVIIAGVERSSQRPVYAVVELKQWSRASVYDEAENLVRVPGMREPQPHPALQVQTYCSYLADFLPVLWEWPGSVHGLAFLHNADRHQIPDLPPGSLSAPTERRMIFTKDRAENLRTYLRERFAPWRERAAAERLLNAHARPSKQLLAVVADEVASRRHLVLLDEQRTAYELVMRGIRWADRGRRKRVVLVSGGPGSGKSAIALTLLADLAREERPVAHATGSKAFKKTVQAYARRQPRDPEQRTTPVFNYFLDFMKSPPNSLDVLICDEAHRIRNRSTRRGGFTGKIPQVHELIAVAKVPVFLLDDDQAVRPNEVGSVRMIREAADSLDLEVDYIHLGAQFRCGGSPRYERWVMHLLGLAEGATPYRWSADDDYRVALAASPQQMEDLLRPRLAAGQSARISAGFCWPWHELPRGGQLVADVSINDWRRPWNAASDHPPRGIPSGSYWATDPRGFDQIGCIYTAQGFEYDWSGVILGPDLVFRDGQLRSEPTKSHDSAIFRNGRVSEGADRLIRNAYKVLLTRGMRGTLIHSVDPETQEFLANLVPPPRTPVQTAPGVVQVVQESPRPPVRGEQPAHTAAGTADAKSQKH
ncbi:DNA/RNA helicase domain-containing protein [Micromonospora sp. NPDC049274]|uniref:DNA/RNA helicase domain-containing protein n=1 Tax=Micromonospora sp. NPDC049274 TaxID=3154829 RepID=UPI00341900C1